MKSVLIRTQFPDLYIAVTSQICELGVMNEAMDTLGVPEHVFDSFGVSSFYRTHRKDIKGLVEIIANSKRNNSFEFVSNFRSLYCYEFRMEEIAAVLYGSFDDVADEKEEQLEYALVRFAFEEVAKEINSQ